MIRGRKRLQNNKTPCVCFAVLTAWLPLFLLALHRIEHMVGVDAAFTSAARKLRRVRTLGRRALCSVVWLASDDASWHVSARASSRLQSTTCSSSSHPAGGWLTTPPGAGAGSRMPPPGRMRGTWCEGLRDGRKRRWGARSWRRPRAWGGAGAHEDHAVLPPRPALATLQRAGVERQDSDLVGSVLAAEAQVGRWSDDLELSTNRILMEKK